MMFPEELIEQIHLRAGCMPDHRTGVLEMSPWFQNWSVYSEVAGEYMGEELDWEYPRDMALLVHEVPVYRVSVMADRTGRGDDLIKVKQEWRYSTPEWRMPGHHSPGQLWGVHAAIPQRFYRAALGQPSMDYPDGDYFVEMIAQQLEDNHWPRLAELSAP